MRLYAFWGYDLFPFVLGGEVVGMTEKGLVKIKEYGGGAFKPIKILPYDSGKELHTRLGEVADRLRQELRKLEERFLLEARSLMPEIT